MKNAAVILIVLGLSSALGLGMLANALDRSNLEGSPTVVSEDSDTAPKGPPDGFPPPGV